MEHNHSHTKSPYFRHVSSDPMGNEGLFLSHVVLGTFLIGLGFWWWIQSLRRCLTFIRRNSSRYTSSASYGSGCCPNQTAEGVVKIVVSLLGMVVEAVTVSKGRQIQYAHYPFYAGTLVAGTVDVLLATVIFLPEGLDYLAQAMPLVFNAYTLRAQTYDQPILTDASHMLTSYVCVLAAFAVVGEMFLPNHFVFSWIKCMMVMLVGAWHWQTGIVLNAPFPSGWKEGSHDSVMDLAIVCCWQLTCIALLQLTTLAIAAKCHGVSPNWIVPSRYSTGDEERNPNDEVQYTKLLNSEGGED